MNTVLSMLGRLANWRGFVILLVLHALIFGSIIITLSEMTVLTGGIGILDFDLGYSVERVREVFGSYGAEGFALYTRIQLLDLLNPAIYSLIFACIIYLLWNTHQHIWVALIPLVAGLLDYVENLTLFLLARDFPEVSSRLVSVSSALSLMKNMALFAAIAALLIGLIMWCRERLWKNWT